MAAPPGYENLNEWELVNIDGAEAEEAPTSRPLCPSASGGGSKTPPRMEEGGSAEDKRKVFEGDHPVGNFVEQPLKEMEQNTQTQLQEQNQELGSRMASFGGTSSSESGGLGSNSSRQSVIDDLLTQVEAKNSFH